MSFIPDAQGRPIDALLAAYAAGTLSRPLHTLAACHLALSGENRAFVAALEMLKGNELESIAPVALRDRDRRLAAIFDMPAPARTAERAPDEVFPEALVDFTGYTSRTLPWKTKLPGLKEYVISNGPDGEASLMWIKPGVAMPTHTHEGSEVTLVLAGGFRDAFGDYDRGDVAFADEAVDHRPIADPVEGCIAFAVTDAPLRLTGPIGRIVERLFRR